MSSRVALFWPGDARAKPNELALPNVEEATVQLERAFARLGRTTYRVPGFLTKPHEAIERLGPIDDPLVGVCVHWLYGPHTTEGVVGKDNPLLLASNFSGQWPGLVGLLNTGACLESLGRRFSRVWTDRGTFTDDEAFMARLDDWCRTGRIAYAEDDIAYHAPVSPDAAARARRVAKSFRDRRALMLMLGDTSMGMINGYFGPRLLGRYGFAEHKIDQAWIIDRGRRIEKKRIDDALRLIWDADISVASRVFPVSMRYPDHFPHSPPLVLPRGETERWSSHQYGAGGELCLEFGSDNWHPDITGADMILSAHRLLQGENPVTGARAAVASRHKTTVGQDLRGTRRRLMATPATIVETATETDDRLLTVHECAGRLRKSTKWVYRRTRTLPFAICLGPRSWVFSQKGLEKWLAKQRA